MIRNEIDYRDHIKKFLKKEKDSQKIFHFFSYKLIKEIINENKGEYVFKYRNPKTNDLLDYQMNKISDFFAINLKSKYLRDYKDDLKSSLLLQETIVNDSRFEERVMDVIKNYRKNKLTIDISIIEAIMFLYWRARRVSIDFNSYEKARTDNSNETTLGTTDLISEKTNVGYILDFCTFTFVFFGINQLSIIEQFLNKYNRVVKKYLDKENASGNSRKAQLDYKSRYFIAHKNEIQLTKNIKELKNNEWKTYVISTKGLFPIISEPYGTINFYSDDFEFINDDLSPEVSNKILNYLFLSQREIMIFVPKNCILKDKEISNFVLSCIYLDTDISLFYSKNLDLVNNINEIFKKVDLSSEKNDAYDLYRDSFEEIETLFKPEISEFDH